MWTDEVAWPDRSATAADVVAGVNLSGREMIVTGANTGIGLETARALVAQGARVTLACRSREKGEAARDSILQDHPDGKATLMLLDLADLSSVEAFAEAYKATGRAIHALILNAGLYGPPETHTKDGFETTFQVSPFCRLSYDLGAR